jgi:hypothetical protein
MDELTAIPATIEAGTACVIRRTLDDYPASDGWILTLHLQGQASQHVAAAADGDDHLLTLSPAITTALISGHYRYLEAVARGEGEALEGPYPIARGTITVRPDMINATGGSLQDWRARALSIVRAVLLGRLTVDQAAYQLEGTGVTREDLKDLVALEARLSREQTRQRRGGLFAGKAYLRPRRPGTAPWRSR